MITVCILEYWHLYIFSFVTFVCLGFFCGFLTIYLHKCKRYHHYPNKTIVNTKERVTFRGN